MMAYIIDGVVILIFLLAVLIGSKRGFIKTMSGVLAFVAALAVALLLNGAVAELVYNVAVEPPILSALEEQLSGVGTTVQNMEKAFDSLPVLVKNLLTQVGITDVDTLAQNMTVGAEGSLAQGIADVVRSVVVPVLEGICTLVLFILAHIVASLLLRVLDIVAKLPLLKQVNKSLGAVAGILSGVLWVLFAVSVVQVVAAFGTADSAINITVLNDTILTSWLVGINPLGAALREAMVLTIECA